MTADKGVRFLGPRCGSGARKAAWGVRDEPGKAQAHCRETYCKQLLDNET